MDWFEQFDGYCERTDFTYWSEPINAITNLAFIIAALVMWQRVGRNGAARILCVILFMIGIGSYLFHTHATGWAALSDVVPIGAFILVYLYLVNRNLMAWPVWAALLGTMAFAPYAAILVPTLNTLPFFQISNFYWTVPVLLVIYAIALRKRRPSLSRGFLIGAAILSVSITLRSLDELLCNLLPFGTHFLWHCLNAVMLAYMIQVYASHILAERPKPR
ncbi:MAG: ceramidase domain-containing protein [Pseudomonadota bacterium]